MRCRQAFGTPFTDSPHLEHVVGFVGWTDFWESAGLRIKIAALPAAALLSWVFCITQIRLEGRGIGFHLSAGPNPQLPVCVHYSRASRDCKIAGRRTRVEPVQFVRRVRNPPSPPFDLFASTTLVRIDSCTVSCVTTAPLPKSGNDKSRKLQLSTQTKSLSQRLHYLGSLRRSSLSNSGLREALGSTERDMRWRAIGSQAPTHENAHFGCTSIPISDVLSPTSRVLSDSVATRMRHYVASLS